MRRDSHFLRWSLLLSIFILGLTPAQSRAQWVRTNGPGHAAPTAAWGAGGLLQLGVRFHGVFVSADHGATWQSSTGMEGCTVLCFAGNATYLFAGLDNLAGPGGVYRSSDAGVTWQPAQGGLGDRRVNALLAAGDTLLAGDSATGVYRSTDDGDTWAASNTGMETESINALARNGSTFFAAGANFLYQSTDGGQSWGFTSGGQYFPIASLVSAGPLMLAGGFSAVIRSTDGGQTWSDRIEIPAVASLDRLVSFALGETTIYAATISSPGSGGSGVIRSTDEGASWLPAPHAISRVGVQAVILDGVRLVGVAPDKGVLVSTDGGGVWVRQTAGLPPGGNIRALAMASPAFFAGTPGDGVYRSYDSGGTWLESSQESTGRLANETVLSLWAEHGLVIAGTGRDGVFRSTDGGVTWTTGNAGLPPGEVQALDLVRAGGNILLGTGDALYYSTDGGLSWNPTILQGGTVTALAAADGYAYANYVTGISTSDGIYRSTNAGLTWTKVFSSLSSSYISGMRADGPFVYAGVFIGGMLRSTDHGANWQGGGPPGGVPVYSVHVAGPDLFVGTDPDGQRVYRSSDHGASWIAFGDGIPAGQAVEALGGGTPYLFAGTEDEGVWRRLLANPADAPFVPVVAGPEDGLRIEPNPFRDGTTIRFSLPSASMPEVRVYDLGGRVVAKLDPRPAGPGIGAAEFRTGALAAGCYFVRVVAGKTSRTARLDLVR